ncbi:MAG: addiction module protein [Candidatus Omnitrophota bacterium]
MSARLERIEQEALSLSKEEQVELIQRLTLRVHEWPVEIDSAWLEEIERRVANAKNQGAVGRSLEEISREIRGKYS